MVEGLGVSQIFALVPTYLREMGVPDEDRLAFVGLFTALIFVVGMPLVPLWGVWADKYSRKAVIVRSASRRSSSPASPFRGNPGNSR
jgi:DHA1 family multidrug resistance protein-like MFS transporter